MFKYNKINNLISSAIVLIIVLLWVFIKHIITPIKCYQVKTSINAHFYPYAYEVFQNKNDIIMYYERSLNNENLNDIKDFFECDSLNFNDYTYILVEGAQVRTMYYSIYHTITNEIYINWYQSIVYLLRDFKQPLHIDYYEPDNNTYIYSIKRNNHIRPLFFS